MSNKVNIRQIARICGVSPATVSRAINRSAPVNLETRRKIEAAMEQYHYQLPPTQSPKSKKCGAVGVLVPDLRHDFFQHVMAEIDVLLREQGSYMIAFPERQPNVLQRIEKIPLDGVILLSEEETDGLADYLKQRRLSVVVCGALSLNRQCPAVHVDDLSAAYDGTNYLLKLGHREIGFISDTPRSISSGFQRVAGSRKAMEDRGLFLQEDNVFSQGNDFDSGYQGAKILLDKNPRLTAIFTHSDASAVGAILALEDMGRVVPDDISVLGFDDLTIGERIRPRLTCVHQPVREIVAKSLELLYESVDSGQPSTGHPSITLPHRITVRDSCRAVE